MKATRANQRMAADIAATRKPNPAIDYRAIREANMRKTAEANRPRARKLADLEWLARDIHSTPYATVIAS